MRFMKNYIERKQKMQLESKRFDLGFTWVFRIGIILTFLAVIAFIFYGFAVWQCDQGRGSYFYCRVAHTMSELSKYQSRFND